MKKKDIDLEAMRIFLTQDIDIEMLISNLDKLYYKYTDIAMRLSSIENEPIYECTLSGRYWIQRLKEIFEEIQIQNTTNHDN